MTEDNVIPFPQKKKASVPVHEPVARKMDRIEKTFKVETDSTLLEVEDGHDFLRNLKKEANRQKSMKNAENLMQQALDVEFLPTVESVSEEIALADSFEIIEED